MHNQAQLQKDKERIEAAIDHIGLMLLDDLVPVENKNEVCETIKKAVDIRNNYAAHCPTEFNDLKNDALCMRRHYLLLLSMYTSMGERWSDALRTASVQSTVSGAKY